MSSVHNMTLEEKIKLVCGADFWHTHAIERLGIRQYMFADGPYGLRKQEGESDHLGLNESVKAICFPTGSAMGASFNKELTKQLGEILGQFARQENVDILLGPSMNIKRSPLCGRNFEYFSEDPYLTGELATAYVRGVQSRGVGASPKHFALNNQEYYRMTSSSNADERTMREIYLKAFEQVVKDSDPITIMSSYNRVNGTYASDHPYLLTGVLRKEWGFSGVVVSDWGGSNQRATNLKAGLDISMPHSNFLENQLIKGLANETISEDDLDQACQRIITMTERLIPQEETDAISLEKGHEMAKLIADETIVLLKNENVLPLSVEEKILFVGPFAKKPRFQGGGSSHINSYRPTNAYDSVPLGASVDYVEGYSLSDADDQLLLRRELVEKARKYHKVVAFIGLPDEYESEGYDRAHLRIPQQQLDMINDLAQLTCKIIVVLHNGSPVELPFASEVEGIIEAYLGGEAVGEAVSDILYGKVNPSGRLAESFPVKLQDTPTYLTYGKEKENVSYHEGIFVGYRYYQSKEIAVQYPFGYGLSYTSFSYDNVKVLTEPDKDTFKVSVSVSNTGDILGKEVVQLYIQAQDPQISRPYRELKAFEKIMLEPGQTQEVTFNLSYDIFNHWSNEQQAWQREGGVYDIVFGKNVEDKQLSATIAVEALNNRKNYSLDSVITDFLEDDVASTYFSSLFSSFNRFSVETDENAAISTKMIQESMGSMPLRALLNYVPQISEDQAIEMLSKINNNSD